MGKYPLNIFYTTSTTSSKSDADLIKSIIELRGDFTSELVKDYLNFKPVIRLTNYLKVKHHTLLSHLFTIRLFDIPVVKFNNSLPKVGSCLVLHILEWSTFV